ALHGASAAADDAACAAMQAGGSSLSHQAQRDGRGECSGVGRKPVRPSRSPMALATPRAKYCALFGRNARLDCQGRAPRHATGRPRPTSPGPTASCAATPGGRTPAALTECLPSLSDPLKLDTNGMAGNLCRVALGNNLLRPWWHIVVIATLIAT